MPHASPLQVVNSDLELPVNNEAEPSNVASPSASAHDAKSDSSDHNAAFI